MTDDKEKLEFAIRDERWAADLQSGLENYMMGLYESVENDNPNDEVLSETESGQPFCGCNVCEGRELLAYIVPRTIDGFLRGSVAFFKNNEEVVPPTTS